MIEINLVPDIKQALIKAQHIRSAVIVASIFAGVISISIIVLLSMFVFGVQGLRNSTASDEIVKKDGELSEFTDLSKTLTIQNQLTKISTLNSNKKIYSRIFDLLGAIIPPAPDNILISNITVNSDTRLVVIEGQAPNSYAALEVFKKTIEGAKLKYPDTDNKALVAMASDVSTSDTSYGEDSSGAKVLRFKLSFTYSQEVFSPASKNTKIVITVNGVVTDSYLGIPKSIFADPATDITEDK